MRHEKRRVKGQLQNVYILRPAHPYGRGEGEGTLRDRCTKATIDIVSAISWSVRSTVPFSGDGGRAGAVGSSLN